MVAVGNHNDQHRATWIEGRLKGLQPGSRLLDAGAGQQRFKPFCSHLRYVSQDLAQYDGKGNERGLQRGEWEGSGVDIVSDIASIPEPDASFDAILCSEVFEHLAEPVSAIREFSRLLRKDGELILTAPFCSLTHFAPAHFCTGFNRYYFEHHLPGYGFTIVEMEVNGNFFEYLAQEIRRIPWVSRRYSLSAPGPIDRLGMYLVLRLLQRFSHKDRGSAEMLNFGIHIHAVKQ